MPKQKTPDAPPPIYVDGEPIAPEEGLLRWIGARAARWPRTLFRLPFTFAPGSTSRATIGLGDGARVYRLDDSALGVSLADRLRRASPADAAARRTIWLSVRMGALLDVGPRVEGTPVVSVFVVHEALAPDASAAALRAQADRSPEGLAVRLIGRGHCARGSKRCAKCAEAEAEPATPALLDLCPDDEEAARPTIAVDRDGKKTWVPYDIIRRFASVGEAAAFAARHALLDVRLDVSAP